MTDKKILNIIRNDDATFLFGYLKVVKLMVQPANINKLAGFYFAKIYF